jgi:UDP-N-acetylmuramate dehydrogenase
MAAVIQRHIDLQGLHTLASPAWAENYVVLEQADDLPGLLAQATHSDWTVRVLGEGSNLVLGDSIDGLLIHQCCHGITLLDENDFSVSLSVAAGENWHNFVAWCLQQGYYGLENLALIPGTVGAAPIQNIGAYGVEVGQFVETVNCLDLETGERMLLSRNDCEFAYRDSVFKNRLRDKVIIKAVQFRLPRRASPVSDYPVLAQWLESRHIDRPGPQEIFDAVVMIRTTRLPDPKEIPNAGSFFKNPVVDEIRIVELLNDYPDLPNFPDEKGNNKLAAAWMIEQCGFKTRSGPVRVHHQHALVITNPGYRPAAEIHALAEEIVEVVESRFGIRLEQEPRSYG